MTFEIYRAIAAAALRRIAAVIETAPQTTTWETRGREAVGTILEALCAHDWLTVERGPDAPDGRAWRDCVVCGGEAHGADCPVAVLEHLMLRGTADLPPALGFPLLLRQVAGRLPEPLARMTDERLAQLADVAAGLGGSADVFTRRPADLLGEAVTEIRRTR